MAAPSPDKRVPSIADLAALGCCEVVVRVSQYEPEPGNRGPDAGFKPVEWQAIAKHVNASLPWAVAVRPDPDEAERDARRLFAEMNDKPHKRAALAAMKTKPKPPVVAAPTASEDDDLDDLI